MDFQKLNLLDEKELEDIYNSVDERDKFDVLLLCSDELKFKELSLMHISLFTQVTKLVMSFKDQNKAKTAFLIFLENRKFDLYDLSLLLNYCDTSYRNNLFDLICEHLEYNSEFNFIYISVDNLTNFIKLLGDEVKEQSLSRLLGIFEKRITGKKISTVGLKKMINLFLNDKKIIIFNKFVDLFKNNKLDDLDFELSDIIKDVDDNMKLQFLNCFLENNLLNNSFTISQIFEVCSDEFKDEIFKFIQAYEHKTNTEIMDNYCMASCINKYSLDVRLDKLKRLVFDSDKYNHFGVILCLEDVNFKFKSLDFKVGLVLKNISDEKKLKLFEILIYFINKHFELYSGKIPDNNIIYDNLLNFYVDFLNLNKENLVKFINKFGYISLRYLDNDNIKKVINLDSYKFDLFINLFRADNLKLDNDTYNTVINAILQREFMVQCKDDYNIFARLEELINNSSMVEFEKIIVDITNVVNVKKILSKYNIDLKTFLENLFSGKSEMLDILHEITNQYIMKKRENYVKTRMLHVNEQLDLNKKYEKNFIKKKWIATTSVFDISWKIRCFSYQNLTEEQLFLKDNRDILDKIIKFKKSPKDYVLDEHLKKYLKVFDSLLDILYENNKLEDPTNDPNAKYVYSAKDIELYNFIDLISELDISKLDKFILSDENLLSNLDDIFSKYKLLGWGKTFSALKDCADFDFSSSSLVGLFDYFHKINFEVIDADDKRFSLTKLISLANCYSSSSSKYGLLFGTDVFRAIAANEGKNKASMARYKRLQLAVEHVKKMYNRERVPVPAMDKNITINNGKKMNVVVGNTTNMDNLVLGENTSSCMRIGGAFYDFYKECLEGDVGFHIILSDSNTNKFISRVSGIRNGNTLFLNELRNSECEDYTNEDCVDAIREVAKILIDSSSSSEYPIDNVVITSDYAMGEHKDKLIDLNLSDRNAALFGLKHNLNVNGSAILLASSSNDGNLVDIKLGKELISYYKPQRDKVREYTGEDAIRRVVQLEGILNNLLKGVSFEDIDIDLNIDVVRCISGSDWYISIDSSGNIKQFILGNSIDKERAFMEMASYMDFINDNYVNLGRRNVK